MRHRLQLVAIAIAVASTALQCSPSGGGRRALGTGRAAQPAVYRDGRFLIDRNGNHTWDGAAGGDSEVIFGEKGDIPIVGDWDGDGRWEVAVFRDGQWLLDFNANGRWDGAEGGDRSFTFGQAGDVPVSGDWNGDGAVEVGVYRTGLWLLDANGNQQSDGPGAGDLEIRFGDARVVPLSGDWNGNGHSRIGTWFEGLWALDYNGDFAWDGPGEGVWYRGEGHDRYTGLGQKGDHCVPADWNGDGIWEAAVFQRGRGLIDQNDSGRWDGPEGGDLLFDYGEAGDIPLAAPW